MYLPLGTAKIDSSDIPASVNNKQEVIRRPIYFNAIIDTI